ncbi:hypothetical protein O7630_35585 [Micromonospora sp. WMMD718]|uniref:hypothetical protein n=1 Tax=Micromonospora sp. WMMD718 TaxID=3016098 RepID=UPI002416FFED|nr:hypothetical protein [Micromonospora sp. WMMD718]MDG4756238.1 hypothetical protein [Micromonospora sp. WMMD718]MDG4756273.1 hypothetical protein [Micromonospora sp. WMMD718]
MTTTWRWGRDGKQRLYVVGDDQVQLGYVDLVTGQPADVRLGRAEEFYTAVTAWRHATGRERQYTADELAGLVCAHCGVDYRQNPDRERARVPTFAPGTLQPASHGQLVACVGECAARQSGSPHGMGRA